MPDEMLPEERRRATRAPDDARKWPAGTAADRSRRAAEPAEEAAAELPSLSTRSGSSFTPTRDSSRRWRIRCAAAPKRSDSRHQIGQILIPTEEVVELRDGKKVTSKRLLYPGYVLVEMDMNDELWHAVKATPRVTGFVGGGNMPVPLIGR